jgi:hypothetical protein
VFRLAAKSKLLPALDTLRCDDERKMLARRAFRDIRHELSDVCRTTADEEHAHDIRRRNDADKWIALATAQHDTKDSA